MKKYLILFLAAAFVPHLASAENTFEIYNIKNPATYYESEYITLHFTVPTPHEPYTATYYIVDEKKNKKTKLGTVDMSESRNQGFGIGLIINQKKGKYHYLTVLDNGREKLEYVTESIEILSKKKASKFKIRNFNVDFGPSKNYTYYGPGDYRLSLTSELENHLIGFSGEATLKCSRPLTLHSKMGNIDCTKKPTKMDVGSKISEVFGVYSKDIVKPVKLEVMYSIFDSTLKKIDGRKAKVTLSTK